MHSYLQLMLQFFSHSSLKMADAVLNYWTNLIKNQNALKFEVIVERAKDVFYTLPPKLHHPEDPFDAELLGQGAFYNDIDFADPAEFNYFYVRFKGNCMQLLNTLTAVHPMPALVFARDSVLDALKQISRTLALLTAQLQISIPRRTRVTLS